MLYYEPLDDQTPDASYKDGDPDGGIEGSIPPARGFEAVMREVVAVIDAAGLTRSDDNLAQLLQAINVISAREISPSAGYRTGLALSLNAADPDHDIDIAAGIARDSTNSADITVPAMTKRGDALWAPGTSSGMLSTGALAGNTSYYLFAIAKADGTANVILHAGRDPSANLPAGYRLYALLNGGRPLKTDSHGNFFNYFGNRWRSENFTYANNTAVPLECPATSELVDLELWGKCITANGIFSAGDIVLFGTSDSSGSNRGYTARKSGGRLTLHVRAGLIQYTVLNPAQWELYFTAEERNS